MKFKLAIKFNFVRDLGESVPGSGFASALSNALADAASDLGIDGSAGGYYDLEPG